MRPVPRTHAKLRLNARVTAQKAFSRRHGRAYPGAGWNREESGCSRRALERLRRVLGDQYTVPGCVGAGRGNGLKRQRHGCHENYSAGQSAHRRATCGAGVCDVRFRVMHHLAWLRIARVSGLDIGYREHGRASRARRRVAENRQPCDQHDGDKARQEFHGIQYRRRQSSRSLRGGPYSDAIGRSDMAWPFRKNRRHTGAKFRRTDRRKLFAPSFLLLEGI